VQTNPWTQFAQVYGEGADTPATVSAINDGGLVVELPMEVEGFVPSSELRNGPQQFDQFYQPGDKMELRVIKFDPSNKEIVLSETAKQRAEEHAARSAEERERRETRQRERREVSGYTERQGASGPTTLGELSGLASLKAQIEEAEAAAELSDKAAEAEPPTESAELHPAESPKIPHPEHDDATIVDEGPTPEEQAEADMAESDATAVTSSHGSGKMEGTPGVANRAAGKGKEESGDKRVDESGGAGSNTEPPASRAQRKEDAGDVAPSEMSKATIKGVGDTEKEGTAEAAEFEAQDKTPTAETGAKPVAGTDVNVSTSEVESFTKPTGEDRIVNKDDVGAEEDEEKS
ncbi:MAG: S1 RNA-binding domain-containing protein, partial [Bacteroidota bacterium]